MHKGQIMPLSLFIDIYYNEAYGWIVNLRS